MSNALTVHTGEPPAHRPEPKSVSGMAPMTFEQFIAMGDALVQTGFLPKHITTGAKAAAIILAGQELGMAPMRALRSLILVEGKVVENADSQLARFKSDGGRAIWKQLDEKGAALWLRHPNGDEHTETFTIEDAGKAKLLNKDVWQKYPKAMLRSRVITAGLKSIGWEGGAGAYDPDEAQGFAPSSAQSAIATVASAEPEPVSPVMPAPGNVEDAIKSESKTDAPAWANDPDVKLTDEGVWLIKSVPLDAMSATDLKVSKVVAQKRGYQELVKACDKLLTEKALA